MPDIQSAPSVRARQLARELRRMREAARLQAQEVARTLEWSASKLSRIENGHTAVGDEDLERLIGIYGIPQQQAGWLRTLASSASARGWWDAYAEAMPAGYTSLLETEANSYAVQCYCAVVPHALIQATEYSRAVILSSAQPPSSKELEWRLDIVRRRQEALDATAEHGEAVRVAVVLDESVILRLAAAHETPAGGDASAEQLEHLVALAAHPRIDIRVLEYSAGVPPISSGSFSLLTPFAGSSPDIVCFENKSRAFFIEEEYEVRSYVQDFERLSDMALSRERSVERLRAAVASHRGECTE